MSSPIGLIRNRAATRATRGSPAGAGEILRMPEDFAALEAALAEFREAGVAAIVIEGGDGTVREVVSRAFRIWGGSPPPFSLRPTGNTNLIARSAGCAPRGGAPLAPERLRRSVLPVLKAEREGAEAMRGFIVGAGAYEAATRFAREEIGARHGLQVLLAVLRLLRSRALRGPWPIGFAASTTAPESAPRMLVAATSLPGALLFGLSPFWGSGSGRLRFLDIAAEPPRLALAAPFVALGRPRRWMSEAYRSGRSEVATLRLETPFVMDGEPFAPGADGLVRLTASETATFLSV
ncbi:MAG: diacylglycerol kinase family protein [Pikeienuella sp.]|uniref:diacylglycerol kinase family protein n=1 Tax=Pikeienuella sp. TaxID=2831957 RepID=UPI0039188837